MRIIQYFLIGLFLSLFTIPAFSLPCPEPFVFVVDHCEYGSDVLMVFEDTNPTSYMYDGNFLPGSPFYEYVLNRYPTPGAISLNFQATVYPGGEVPPSGSVNFNGSSPATYNIGYGDFSGGAWVDFWSPLLSLGGGTVNTPVALFDIDGIKDNIFATLLVIVGVLLVLVSLKYAWSSFSNLFKQGHSSNFGRGESSVYTGRVVSQYTPTGYIIVPEKR